MTETRIVNASSHVLCTRDPGTGGRAYRRWVWGGVVPGVVLGLAAFGVGCTLGRRVEPLPAAGLTLAAMGVFFGGGLLAKLPPVARVLAPLRGWRAWEAVRWGLLVGYGVLVGLAAGLASPAGKLDAWRWVMALGVGVSVLLGAAMLTRTVWRPGFARWQAVRRRLALVTLGGFLGLLILSLIQAPGMLVGLLAILLAGLLSLMMLLGILQTALGEVSGSVLDQVSGLLYPCLGLLVVLGIR